jgi:hypothetical protein
MVKQINFRLTFSFQNKLFTFLLLVIVMFLVGATIMQRESPAELAENSRKYSLTSCAIPFQESCENNQVDPSNIVSTTSPANGAISSEFLNGKVEVQGIRETRNESEATSPSAPTTTKPAIDGGAPGVEEPIVDTPDGDSQEKEGMVGSSASVVLTATVSNYPPIAGQTSTFKFTVTNDGKVKLKNIQLASSFLTNSPDQTFYRTDELFELSPGQSIRIEITYTWTGNENILDFNNSIEALAIPVRSGRPGGDPNGGGGPDMIVTSKVTIITAGD